MLSNYPPGVTGNELEIAGPDFDCTGVEFCRHCDSEQEGVVAGYRGDQWFTCARCDEITDLADQEPAVPWGHEPGDDWERGSRSSARECDF